MTGGATLVLLLLSLALLSSPISGLTYQVTVDGSVNGSVVLMLTNFKTNGVVENQNGVFSLQDASVRREFLLHYFS